MPNQGLERTHGSARLRPGSFACWRLVGGRTHLGQQPRPGSSLRNRFAEVGGELLEDLVQSAIGGAAHHTFLRESSAAAPDGASSRRPNSTVGVSEQRLPHGIARLHRKR